MRKEEIRTKLVILLQNSEWKKALNTINGALKLEATQIELLLLKAFCALQLDKKRTALISLNNVLKLNANHELVLGIKEEFKNENPNFTKLDDFVRSYIRVNAQKPLSKEELDQLIYQITVKQYIK